MEQFPSDFFMKSLLKTMKNVPRASWGNFHQFSEWNPYWMANVPRASYFHQISLLNPHWKQWNMLPELPGAISTSFLYELLIENNEKCSQKLSGAISISFLDEILIKSNANASRASWSSFHQSCFMISLLKTMKMLPELPGAISTSFLYEILIESNEKCSQSFWGSFP